MKKLMTLILAMGLVLSLAGCCLLTANVPAKRTAEDYMAEAQTYINAGDYDRAIEILEEGIEETDAAALKTMLATVNAMRPTVPVETTETPTEAPTEVPTVAPTEPPATTQPAPQVSVNTQYEINIFLSNFAEQSFNAYDLHGNGLQTRVFRSDSGDVAAMAHFLMIYHKVNNPGYIEYIDGHETLTLTQLNQQAYRFFGRTFSEQQLINAGVDVRNGCMYEPMASGESYCSVAIGEVVKQNSDGTYVVKMTIYEATGHYAQGHGGITDNSVYYLNSYQAAHDGDLIWKTAGTAIIRPYNDNGRATYQLVEYCLEGQT